MALTHINNRSDFQLLLKMEEGKTFPEFDFTLAFQTTGGFRYNVKSDDSKRFTPNADRTQAVITFDFADGNYFPNGRLAYTIKANMQNAMFPDGYENTQTPRLLDMVIWDGASDYSDAVEVDFVLPYVGVQAKSVSPAMLDTSNVLRKRIPLGAQAYQLYYTNMVRVPNALAKQAQFDKEVPQWLWKFLNELLSRYGLDNISVYLNGVKTEIIGYINVEYDNRKRFVSLDTKITFDTVLPGSTDYRNIYIELPRGVYYFDNNRALRRLGGAEVSFGEHFLPDYSLLPDNFKVARNKYLFNNAFADFECYVRRRKNHNRDDGNYRWYYYWRKTRRLRQLSNAPVLAIKNQPVPQMCLVRVRKRLNVSNRGMDRKHRTSPITSKWKYFTVLCWGSRNEEIRIKQSRDM